MSLRITAPSIPLALADLVETTTFARPSRTTWPLEDLRSGESVTYDAHAPHRGEFTCGPAALVVTDPLGLARARRVLDSGSTHLAWPRIQNSETETAAAPGDGDDTIASSHATHAGRPGASIRPYVRGDDLRSVHWPATAHRGEMMVRQFDPPAEPRTHVVVVGDVPTAGTDAAWEHLLTEAASTCVDLDARSVPTAVTIGDVRALQLDDVMDALARAATCEPAEDATSEDNTTLLFLHTSARTRPTPPRRAAAKAWVSGPRADEAVTSLQDLGWDARRLFLPQDALASHADAPRPARTAPPRAADADGGSR